MTRANEQSTAFVFIVLVVASLVVFFLNLLNPGIFWDDHTLFGVDAAAIHGYFRDNGRPWFGWLHGTLTRFPHAELWYRFLIFFAPIATALLAWRASRVIPGMSRAERAVLALIWVVTPFVTARPVLVLLQYFLAPLFFWAWVLLYLRGREWWAAPFLLLSFSAEYHMVLMLAVWPFLLRFKEGSRKFAHQALWPGLAILSMLALRAIFKPSGIFQGLHELSARGVLGAFKRFHLLVWESVGGAIGQALHVPLLLALGFAIGAVLIRALYTGSYSVDRDPRARAWAKFTLVFAGALFVAGAWPFLAVGKVGAFTEIDSRYQIALIAPWALLVAVLPRALGVTRPAAFGIWTFAFALGASVQWKHSFAYGIDAHKQSVLREQSGGWRTSDASWFALSDDTRRFNALGRTLSFYEWSALLNSSGSGTKVIVNPVEDGVDLGRLEMFRQHPFAGRVFRIDGTAAPLKMGRLQVEAVGEPPGFAELLKWRLNSEKPRIWLSIREITSP